MPKPASVYPILYTFKSEGDVATVKSLKLWVDDFHLEPPQTAVNDNNPSVEPYEWETRIDAVDAMDLIRSAAEDENCKRNSHFKRTTPSYSTDLHHERFDRVKRASKSAPPPPDYVNAEAETNRYIDAVKMRSWLGCDADVLDLAVEPRVTFDDVAQHIGLQGDTAATEAKKEVKDIAATFYERAA